ncbi:hypothetical protein P691DRAFT_688063, partial [Macrolepiota fuliginosa MF-IS2]
AYLILTLRCTRVIEHENEPQKWPATQHLKSKLNNIINMRLKMDCLHANAKKYGAKAISRAKVIQTWSGTLHDEGSMPPDWPQNPGVLVGIRIETPSHHRGEG